MTKHKRLRKLAEQKNNRSSSTNSSSNILQSLNNAEPTPQTTNFTIGENAYALIFNYTLPIIVLRQLAYELNMTRNTNTTLPLEFINTTLCYYGFKYEPESEEPIDLYSPLDLYSYGDWRNRSEVADIVNVLNLVCQYPVECCADAKIEVAEALAIVAVIILMLLCIYRCCCRKAVYDSQQLIERLQKIETQEPFEILTADEIRRFEAYLLTASSKQQVELTKQLNYYKKYVTEDVCFRTGTSMPDLTLPVTIAVNYRDKKNYWVHTCNAAALAQFIKDNTEEPLLQIPGYPDVNLLDKNKVNYCFGHNPIIENFIGIVRSKLNNLPEVITSSSNEKLSIAMLSSKQLQTVFGKRQHEEQKSLIELSPTSPGPASRNNLYGSING